MKKLQSIIICLLVLFVSINFAQKQGVKQTKKKSKAAQKKKVEFVCQLPASVIDVELEQTSITLNNLEPDKSFSSDKIIKVKAIALDIEEMKYVYTVSCGKIIGEGANVEWDLSDAKPGNCIITVGISQPIFNGTRWEVLGMAKTRVITVKE